MTAAVINMAKILFIDPRGWQGAVNNNVAFPNVGIAYLIPPLLKNGFDVAVIDLNNESRTDSEVLSIITDLQPNIICFSVKTATMKDARNLARKIKQLQPDTPIIIGGPHTTLAWSELVQEPWFDVIFVGEGEQTLPIICDALLKHESLEHLPGVVTSYNVEKGLKLNRSLLDELDILPFPNYDFFPKNVKEFIRTNYPLVTTRGCIYNCIYCSVPEICGKKFRNRAPKNIVAELKWAKNVYDIQAFEIIDDVFNLDIERCKEICRQIIEEKMDLSWTCPNGLRADRVDKELADLMYRSGCSSVMVGIESADPVVLASVKKGESIEDIEKGIRIFQAAGIKVGGYFIIGLPGDSFKSQEQSVEFIKRLGITAHFNMLVPYPGTNLWKWVQNNAHLRHDIEEGLHFADSSGMVDPIFETADFSAVERLHAYEMVHTRIGRFDLVVPSTYSNRRLSWQKLMLKWKYDRSQLLPFILESRYFKWLKKGAESK
jgi:anaerobic magnesium-protoporphyrin IX monomethyl ester cyclase